jgi:predicted amidophosphoribosyltransferase
VILFDDVLTTGKHFMCCKRRLREHLGDIPVTGLFIARRVPPDVSIEFDVILDDE